MRLVLCLALAAAALPRTLCAQEGERKAWIVIASKVHTGTGDVIADGMVTVNNGKIALVTPSLDDNSPELTLRCFAVTAGLIDASVRAHGGFSSVEQSREVTPELRVADALDPWSLDWDRQVRNGVTTVLVNPLDRNVIGGIGAVVKTAGPVSVAARVVKRDAVLRGAIGSEPSSGNHPAGGRPSDFYSRRPTTRMGVEWEWRKAFYDTALGRNQGAPGREELVQALKGQLPVSIQAWTTQDIRTAVFLREEVENGEEFKAAGMNTPRFFIDAAAEAWREPQLLARSRTPVVLPPFPTAGRTRDGAFMAWNCAAELRRQGVAVALSSHGSDSYDQSLPMQAAYAMSGGLSFEDALAAVTSVPARLLGVESRVGTIATGKDADLVLWSGEPFQPTSQVIAVIVDGVLRHDARPGQAR